MNAAAAPKPNPPPTRLILASSSVTRLRLLQSAGLAFEVQPAAIDEAAIKQSSQAEGASPEETALLLAELKAARIRAPGAVIIGADQLLSCEGRWFDKPGSIAEARAQLQFLRGKTHTLHTAVTCLRDEQVIWHHCENARLHMRAFSDEFLEDYLQKEADCVNSVGAYKVEARGIQLFDKIEGDSFTIQGLPLLQLLGFLRQHRVILD